MAEIAVECRQEGGVWRCEVTVREGVTPFRYRVAVASSDLDRLAPGASDPTELVRGSFLFLLEREPKESILREFELAVISRYFPEYEREIRETMRRG